jgi:hypothetical protein
MAGPDDHRAHLAESTLAHRLSSKVMKGGLLPQQRAA